MPSPCPHVDLAGLAVGGRTATVAAMTKVTQLVGAHGERLAARYLTDLGMVVLDRNWRSAAGEIDIVARDGEALVICEVKTRRRPTFGTPAEAIGPRKVARLRRLAAEWLAETRLRPREVRFDVIEVTATRSRPPRVRHVTGAF